MKKLLLFFCLSPFIVKSQTLTEIGAFQAATGRDTLLTGQGSQLSINQNILLPTAGSTAADANSIGVTSYRSVQITIVPASGTVTAGVITFEQSNDNFVSTAVPLFLYDVSSITANPVSSYTVVASTPRTFAGNLACKYVRARISTAITGTTTGVQAFTTMRTSPFIPSSQYVYNATAANLQTTATISGNPTVFIGNTPNTTAILVESRTGTSNGSTATTVNSAATTNAAFIKASPGMLYQVICFNSTVSTKYVRLYNKTSAPTVGTDVPVMIIAIPALSSKEVSLGDVGLKFSSGIAYSITGSGTVLDATAVAVGDVLVTFNWQ